MPSFSPAGAKRTATFSATLMRVLRARVAVDPSVAVIVRVEDRADTPSVPVTVIVYVPAGVEAEVAMVNTDVHVGVQEGIEYEAVAPAGRPDSVKDTGAGVPETRVAVRVLDTLWPAVTV